MKQAADWLSVLLPSEAIYHAGQMNMPYLGYHLLRETLTQRLLGESEAPILYWMGKELGRHIPMETAADLILPFIRLGLGKLDVLEEGAQHFRYSLTHSIYAFMPEERLRRTLHWEAGVIAGAIQAWREGTVFAQIEIQPQKADKERVAVIAVRIGESKQP